MNKVIMLFGLSLIERDLGFYLSNEVISAKVGKGLGDLKSQYVKMVAPNAMDLVEGFGIDPVYAPIATDYEEFNKNPITPAGELGPLPML